MRLHSTRISPDQLLLIYKTIKLNPEKRKYFYINKFNSKYPYSYRGLFLLKTEEFKKGLDTLSI